MRRRRDWKHYLVGFSCACLARMAWARASNFFASASRFIFRSKAA